MSGDPANVEYIRNLVLRNKRVLPRGGGTKTALSTPRRDEVPIDMKRCTGMIEYDPEEFTFTAYAGTTLTEIERELSQHRQSLPFEPPMVERGATLGGTVASGLSGSGRLRHGGLRDFILGVRFIDGRGELVRGGGKVVKNVAGYDFPKLMVGSLGGLGVLVEITFKVFPNPAAYATWQRDFEELGEALDTMRRAMGAVLPLDALDLEATPSGYTLWVRMGGMAESLSSRLERLKEAVGEGKVRIGQGEGIVWGDCREFKWVPQGYYLIKVPITPRRIPALEAGLVNKPVLRRYTAGGQLAWLAMFEPPRELDPILTGEGLSGLVILGLPGFPRIGKPIANSFHIKVKDVLDPAHRFTEV